MAQWDVEWVAELALLAVDVWDGELDVGSVGVLDVESVCVLDVESAAV